MTFHNNQMLFKNALFSQIAIISYRLVYQYQANKQDHSTHYISASKDNIRHFDDLSLFSFPELHF